MRERESRSEAKSSEDWIGNVLSESGAFDFWVEMKGAFETTMANNATVSEREKKKEKIKYFFKERRERSLIKKKIYIYIYIYI